MSEKPSSPLTSPAFSGYRVEIIPAQPPGNGAATKTKASTLREKCGNFFHRSQVALDHISFLVQNFLEDAFYYFGRSIAERPRVCMLTAILVALVMSCGIVFMEHRKDSGVWLPRGSELQERKKFMDKVVPMRFYHETVLLWSDRNILTPEIIAFMERIDQTVQATTFSNLTYEGICARPSAMAPIDRSNLKISRRRKRRKVDGGDEVDESEVLVRRAYFEEAAPVPTEMDNEMTILPEVQIPDVEVSELSPKETDDIKSVSSSGPEVVPSENTVEEPVVMEGKEEVVSELDEFLSGMSESDPELKEIIEAFMKESDRGGPCIRSSILPSFYKDKHEETLYTFEELQHLDLGQLVTDAMTKKSLVSSAQNFSVLMSGLRESRQGKVESATATLMVWSILAPKAKDRENDMSGIDDYLDWERTFVKNIQSLSPPAGVQVASFTSHSFLDAMDDVLDANMPILFSGFGLILVYVIVSLGRCNRKQQRIYVSLVGLSVVGLSISGSYGFCSFIRLPFGPIHPILPFLILGIGVDDMFVIIQSFENLSASERKLPVEEQIARALKTSGASITITSLTDVLAFGIGATTTVPCLMWFCLYAASGIMFVFILQLVIFVPFLCLDEKRKVNGREACCWRILPPEYLPNHCSQRNFLVEAIDRFYAPGLLTWPAQTLVLLVSATVVCINIYGVVHLEYNFRPEKYISYGSYQDVFLKEMKNHFPLDGDQSAFYFGRLDYLKHREALVGFSQKLKENEFVKATSVDFWYEGYLAWLHKEDRFFPETDEEFEESAREFLLFSVSGLNYIKDMIIEGDLLGEFNISGCALRFRHIPLKAGWIKEAAMQSIFNLEDEMNNVLGNGSRVVAAYTRAYVSWESNKAIAGELFRNLGLTLVAVFCVTLVLIGDFRVSLWVFLCVLLTLLDIGGCMYYWGLSIEILTSIQVILSCGLAVDYSAHVGHMFVVQRGQRKERAHASLVKMGPAVWSGGFSTFLAVILLSCTDAYVFYTFFKIFVMVVAFGLFHGLCFLPVILSLVGPSTLASWSMRTGGSLLRPNSGPAAALGPDDSCAQLRPSASAVQFMNSIPMNHTERDFLDVCCDEDDYDEEVMYRQPPDTSPSSSATQKPSGYPEDPSRESLLKSPPPPDVSSSPIRDKDGSVS